MRKYLLSVFPFIVLLSFGTSNRTQPALVPPDSDLVAISGATLIDGSGQPPVKNSLILIKGDSIMTVGVVGRLKIPSGARLIDARGLVLAPGFIDAHSHSDRGLDEDPAAKTQVSQGITTVAVGQDGGSEFPVGEFLEKLHRSPTALNVLTFVGHATVRSKIMGEDTNRTATQAEIDQMESLVEQAMNEGAFGLSSGLEYETGKPATTEELISLAQVAGRYGGIYISHIRDEADKTLEALAEAIQIGRQGHLPVQISHIKVATVAVWGKANKAVALINRARRRGQDVTADCYPYDAWSSTIRVLIPSGRHDDPTDVRRGIEDVGGAGNITIVSCKAHPDYEFQTLEAIAQKERISSVDLYMKIVRDGGAGIVCRSMKESDIRVFYQQPWVMVSSDGGIGSRHPRGTGTYPRVLGRFVRELHWLTLPEAIRKMTSLPAARFKLRDRGLIRVGQKADIVLFDPLSVIDRATFPEPQLISEGVKRVFVNGIEVWRDGVTTGSRPGVALRNNH
ncbi:MAG: D-aminoacylase [Pyrinomonadaceae bacterium]|nr:D-aminoacylase [Pyrinomonadaceae bacterium]